MSRLSEVGKRPNIYLFSNHAYNPPWIYDALSKIPINACGVCLGEIPADWRTTLTDVLQLRVCPRTFVFHARREGQSLACTLILNLDRPGSEGILRDDLEKCRHRGLREWQTRFPALKQDQHASALLDEILHGMRWQAGSGNVQTHLRIPVPAGKP